MQFCFCGQPVFGKGYCKSHQHLRPDFDGRSIVQKAMAKNREKLVVRTLNTYQVEEGIVDSVSELTIDLDRIISRYCRLRDMEADGKITCYICSHRVKYERAHAMHFINRQHLGTRFLLENIKSGCYECNVVKRGNLVLYEKKLNEENNGIVDWLKEQSYVVANPTRDELKNLLTEYQFKLKLVESKLK